MSREESSLQQQVKSGETKGEEARDQEKKLGQAPGPGSELEDANLHFTGSTDLARDELPAGIR